MRGGNTSAVTDKWSPALAILLIDLAISNINTRRKYYITHIFAHFAETHNDFQYKNVYVFYITQVEN
jgi:hypothetical protein